MHTVNLRSSLAAGLVAAVTVGAMALPTTAGHPALPSPRIVSGANIAAAGLSYSTSGGIFDSSGLEISVKYTGQYVTVTLDGDWIWNSDQGHMDKSGSVTVAFDGQSDTFTWSSDATGSDTEDEIYGQPGRAVAATAAQAYRNLFAPAGDTCEGCDPYPPMVYGEGVLTAAVANPAAALHQMAYNMVGYAGRFTYLPADEAIASIAKSVAAHAKAVAALEDGKFAHRLEDELKRAAAVNQAAMVAAKYVVDEIKNGSPAKAWAAFVAGYVAPTGYDGKVTSSVPGTKLALSTGAGIVPDTDCGDGCGDVDYTDPSYIPSRAVEAWQAKAALVHALGGSRGGDPQPDCGSSGSAPCPAVEGVDWAAAPAASAAARSSAPAAAPATAAALQADVAAALADTPAVSAAAPQHKAAAGNGDNGPRGRANHTGARGKRDAG